MNDRIALSVDSICGATTGSGEAEWSPSPDLNWRTVQMTDPTPHSSTPTDVITALARADFGALIGVVEDDQIEFKGHDYAQLTTERSKRDLIADIAAFANHQGGVIVLGAPIAKDRTEDLEYCVEVVGVRLPTLTQERVHKVLQAHTHPTVRGVTLRTYVGPSTRDGDDVTVVVISVPPAADRDRPVIVKRLITDSDAKVDNAFGWPIRMGHMTDWVTADQVQAMLHAQYFGASPATSPSPPASAVDESRLERKEGWHRWGRLVLRARPQRSRVIIDFNTEFRNRANRDWADLREMSFGFRLHDLNPLRNVGGDLVAESPRTLLHITSFGQVTAAAVASPDFLGWAQHPDIDVDQIDVLVMNPYPFIEFCAETVRLAYELVGPAALAQAWLLEGRLEHLIDRTPVAFRLDPYSTLQTSYPAYRNDVTVEFESGGDDWRGDTYRLVSGLLGQAFNIPDDSIPLVHDGMIDPGSWPPPRPPF